MLHRVKRTAFSAHVHSPCRHASTCVRKIHMHGRWSAPEGTEPRLGELEGVGDSWSDVASGPGDGLGLFWGLGDGESGLGLSGLELGEGESRLGDGVVALGLSGLGDGDPGLDDGLAALGLSPEGLLELGLGDGGAALV